MDVGRHELVLCTGKVFWGKLGRLLQKGVQQLLGLSLAARGSSRLVFLFRPGHVATMIPIEASETKHGDAPNFLFLITEAIHVLEDAPAIVDRMQEN